MYSFYGNIPDINIDNNININNAWHHETVELVQELGRRATDITGDSTETTYLFQQLSVAL